MREMLVEKADIPAGTVYLVGAGPGNPDLLTVGALRAILAADALVYDALVSDEILEMAPASCERHFVGKRGGKPSTPQDEINDLLVRLAKEGKRVVRLKGGDPFVFGRGGEEALRLVSEGVPFRVAPGITAGVAGPAYAGIPITHRGVNANVAFLTGHEDPHRTQGNSIPSTVDWEAVGGAFPVIVLYMAIKNFGVISQRLIAGGRSPETPVAVIRWATRANQQTLLTTLENAPKQIAQCDLRPPAIIVIGEVARMRQELAWFDDKSIQCALEE
ncbi:uroporphyrinogen-III C-methyltransferase [Magnetofaba australis]|uniref:uroporphyrinogen-III C-methyltransferase n=1 Tax=Magnetofaba australis IT-1 TaxID=1434232 RepID=A0A1Y2K5Q2_9PROT|nr:uroporphyrinogen-III C-methyltransferase [Magnetofaba australis]OSM04873.1 putative uroporphyrinogen-III C-methyltransferase [Magnetofaba australis IT-1]